MPLVWDVPHEGAPVPPMVARQRLIRTEIRRLRRESSLESVASDSGSDETEGGRDSDVDSDKDSEGGLSTTTSSHVSDDEVKKSPAVFIRIHVSVPESEGEQDEEKDESDPESVLMPGLCYIGDNCDAEGEIDDYPLSDLEILSLVCSRALSEIKEQAQAA